MKSRFCLLLPVLLSLLCACSDGEKITLAAGPGQFSARELGTPSVKGSFAATLEIAEFNPSEKWPTAAYVGFCEGKNRNESVQFLVIRTKPTDDYLVAGYRIIEGGREVKVESLRNVPLTARVSVRMSIENGLVTIKYLSEPPVSLQTSLTEGTPYASVSSGVANVLFRADP